MLTDTKRLTAALIALVLMLVAPISASAANQAPAGGDLTAAAKAFIQTMAQGHFNEAEADFTDQMKQAAPPDKLRQLWESLVQRGGAFQKTGGTETMVTGVYTTVNVRTEFKSRSIGLAVSFDPAHRIAGLHLFPAPGEAR